MTSTITRAGYAALDAMGEGGASGATAVKQERRGDVHASISNLQNSVGETHSLISVLASRLEPVLRPSAPTDSKLEQRIGYATPIANCIETEAHSLLCAAHYLRDLLDRLEI